MKAKEAHRRAGDALEIDWEKYAQPIEISWPHDLWNSPYLKELEAEVKRLQRPGMSVFERIEAIFQAASNIERKKRQGVNDES